MRSATAPRELPFGGLPTAERIRELLDLDVRRASLGARLQTVEVRYARHHTFRKEPENSYAEVLYDLRVNAPSGDASQLVYALAGSTQRCRIAYLQAAQSLLHPSLFGTPLSYIADEGLVLWAFPNDPSLHHIPELLDPTRGRAHIPFASLPEPLDRSSGVEIDGVSVVSYRPRARCVFAYSLRTRIAPEGRPRVFAKMYTSDRLRSAIRSSQALRSTDQGPGAFRFATPLGSSDRLSTLWFEGLHGEEALSALRRDDASGLGGRIATGLARLHRSGAALPDIAEPARDPNDVLKKLQRLRTALDESGEIVSELERWFAKSSGQIRPLAPIHGDFHARQMIVDGEGIGLVDLDEAAMGEPSQDVANFIADLWTTDLPAETIATVRQEMIERYRDENPGELPPDRIRYHLALQMINRAYRAMLRRSDSWPAIADGHLRRALLETEA